MSVVIASVLVAVAAAGTLTVLNTDPARQAVTLSVYGLCLALLFVALAAPDVTLSEISVNAAVVPLLVLLTIRKIRAPR